MNYTFAVGDIHGCARELKNLLLKIEEYSDHGTVVFVGDYIDRGANSKRVIDIIRSGPKSEGWDWITLKGNHEDMMVSTLRSGEDLQWWMGNGGSATVRSFGGMVPNDVLEWAAGLPEVHADDHRIFVHAGVDETIPLADQISKDFLWKRFSNGWSGEYWGKHLVHGHTPDLSGPKTTGNRTCIDAGVVFGGTLACAIFRDDKPGAPIGFITVQLEGISA